MGLFSAIGGIASKVGGVVGALGGGDGGGAGAPELSKQQKRDLRIGKRQRVLRKQAAKAKRQAGSTALTLLQAGVVPRVGQRIPDLDLSGVVQAQPVGIPGAVSFGGGFQPVSTRIVPTGLDGVAPVSPGVVQLPPPAVLPGGGVAQAGLGDDLLDFFLPGMIPQGVEMIPGAGGREGHFQRQPSRVSIVNEVQAIHPTTGRIHTWKHVGRPVLYSGDLATCKRVKKIAARAARKR